MPRNPASQNQEDLPPFLADDTNSESGEYTPVDAEPVFTEEPTANADQVIDNAVDDDRLEMQPFGPKRQREKEKPKSGPPTGDEWLDFFSRIVIRFLTEWYVDMLFSGVDEDLISDQDAEKLLLDEEERREIAMPFAEYANKNPFLRKHGRQVVAFADSFESMYVLVKWFARVNRIARKYKGKKPHQHKPTVIRTEGGNVNGSDGQGPPSEANGHSTTGVGAIGLYNPGSG